ncbi:MAG: metalloregulator ArsR/SmtB family transcription factor [Bacilli bacterium]|jgi:DNA-binding transcriptional ArsR family regulator|nr:metalloregulator ArsR/SmtB family transcription factor [Bacilli bacterium]MCH4211139.1 metalloregulator ArsR/SmtB family transcription factor [Bacilli bacterium]MCH4228313.1 metalloregulator ArsR/SmtB family transcription factor [Bacilli bacterium]MCH4277338.1 metalloregulator ArsR/SmtB family transcription factor [Bacilli bacterium]MCI2055330.1 metalloregulator ArsR/SmtB family transcription factor [Bacilli bacterium]
MKENCESQKLAEEFASCQESFIALGDETRIHIIVEMLKLGDKKGIRVGQICHIANLSRPAVSHHMHYLKQAGFVKVRKEGTKNYYYLDADLASFQKVIDLCHHAMEMAERSKKEKGIE